MLLLFTLHFLLCYLLQKLLEKGREEELRERGTLVLLGVGEDWDVDAMEERESSGGGWVYWLLVVGCGWLLATLLVEGEGHSDAMSLAKGSGQFVHPFTQASLRTPKEVFLVGPVLVNPI
ncbi:unnamed protein product [Prunus armeniaca]